MLTVRELSLRNVVSHADTTFRFDPGIHVIRGANSTGKSLIFTALAAVLFESHPLSSARAREDSEIAVTLDVAVLRRIIHERRLGYRIEVDGRNTGHRTIKSARGFISEIVRFTPEKFYAADFLTSQRPSMLQWGTGVKRRDFFSDVFGLAIYDVIRENLQEQFKTLKRDEARINELAAGLAEVPDSPPRDAVKKLRRKLTALKQDAESLRETLRRHDVRKSLRDRTSWRGTLDELAAKVKSLRTSTRDLLARHDAWIKAEQARQFNASVRRERERMETALAAMPSEATLRFVAEQLRRLPAEKALRAEYEEWMANMPPQGVSMDDAEYAEYNEERKFHLAYVASMEASDAELCAGCGTPVDRAALLEFHRRKIETLDTRLHNADQHRVYSDYMRQESKYAAVAKVDLDWADAFFRRFPSHEDYIRLKSSLAGLPDERDVPDAEPVDIDAAQETLRNAERDWEILASMPPKPDMGRTEAGKKLKQVSVEIDRLVERYGALSAALTAADAAERANADIQRRIDGIDISVLPVCADLVDIYGPRGIKNAHISALLDAYVRHMNAVSDLLNPIRVRYLADVSDSAISILAERNGRVDDVSTLGGAESRCFSLLSALALRYMMPPEQRTNFIVMDEMESNMMEPVRNKFANEFLPVLRETAPCVILVTPMTREEMYVGAATEYLVRKKDGVAFLA